MSGFLDKAKSAVEGIKDKAEDLVEKVGDKLPESIKSKLPDGMKHDEASDAAAETTEAAEGAKSKVDEIKDKVTDVAHKIGEKLPDSVTNKIEDLIPGDSDGDGH